MTFKKIFYEESNQLKDWHSYVSRNPLLKKGVEILEILSKHGKAYIVGGAVRDIIIGNKEPDDIDISTDVHMETTEKLFPTHDIGKNKDFGIVVIEYKGEDFEIANFRSESGYSDGRHPDKIKIELDFESDAGRRDITINSMGIDKDGNILDYFDGKKDIKNKIIKTVGDPDKRFKEDNLRMLRAVRFSSKLGMTIEDETREAIKRNSKNLKNVSVERIMKEFLKMASQDGSKFADAIIELKDVGLLKEFLPEILELETLPHDQEHHPESPNVFGHILAALRTNKIADPILNLSILFHDIGKLKTFNKIGDKLTYYGHASAAFDLINDISKRLKLDNKTKDAMVFSAINHMKFHELTGMKNSKIKKLIDNDNWEVLKNVSLADAKARGKLFNQKEWDQIIDKVTIISKMYHDSDKSDNIKKLISGIRVMKLTGLKPGPNVGKIISDTMTWIIDNSIKLTDTKNINKYIKELGNKI